MNGVSLDSNILLALLRGEETAPQVSRLLNQLSSQQRLVLSGAVYAELIGFYPQLDTYLQAAHIQVMADMPTEAWKQAGEAHAAYTARRRQSGGGLPRRILTDYLIGAHASVHGLSLFTLNVADYGDFPEVPLLTLAGEQPS